MGTAQATLVPCPGRTSSPGGGPSPLPSPVGWHSRGGGGCPFRFAILDDPPSCGMRRNQLGPCTINGKVRLSAHAPGCLLEFLRARSLPDGVMPYPTHAARADTLDTLLKVCKPPHMEAEVDSGERRAWQDGGPRRAVGRGETVVPAALPGLVLRLRRDHHAGSSPSNLSLRPPSSEATGIESMTTSATPAGRQ